MVGNVAALTGNVVLQFLFKHVTSLIHWNLVTNLFMLSYESMRLFVEEFRMIVGGFFVGFLLDLFFRWVV